MEKEILDILLRIVEFIETRGPFDLPDGITLLQLEADIKKLQERLHSEELEERERQWAKE